MNKKALIVDDSEMIREVFSQQLAICGFDTRSCDSLAQTLTIIENWQPNVVFLDLRCLLYTSPSPRDLSTSRMPSSA